MTDSDTTLFDTDQVDEPGAIEEPNPLETLVGDGKKFQSVEDLAKGKLESDRFIAKLERELSELRKDLGTRITMEEFLERQNKPSTNASPSAPKDTGEGDQSPKLKPEDIQRLVKETLTQTEQETRAARNFKIVKDKLQEVWGDNFAKVLTSKAEELEVGVKFLDNLAMTNPKAFFELVGVRGEARKDTYVPTPTTTVDAPRQTTGQLRTFADYERMRKENPSQYWSPRVQNEIHKRTASDLKFQEEVQASYNKQRS